MVNVSAIAHAEYLIEQQASYREIRRETGLSSWVITKILRGEITAEERAGPRLETLVASRCPGCGGNQYQPCQVCPARARQAEGRM